jgi:malonyl CoA-acyl carrier protein transacylase
VAFVLRRPRESWRAELPCYGLLRPADSGDLPPIGLQIALGEPRPLPAEQGVCLLEQLPTGSTQIQQARLFLEALLCVHDRLFPPSSRQSAAPLPSPFADLKQPRPWFGGPNLRPRLALWKQDDLELLLREPAEPVCRVADRWPHEVFLLAADSVAELRERVTRVQTALEECEHLSDLAYGLSCTASGSHRLAVVASDKATLAKALATAAERLSSPNCQRFSLASGVYFDQVGAELPKLCMVFPGQGSQYTNMLIELCIALPSVQSWFDRFDEEGSLHHPAPSEFLFPIPGAHRDADPHQLLMGEEGAEGVSVAAIGLHDLWERLGLVPSAIAGYSIGELTALISAGVFLIKRRGLVRLMAELTRERTPGGRSNYPSIAVTASQRELIDRVIEGQPGELFLALDSCPSQTVLSGTPEAIAQATRMLREGGATVLPLRFDRGYHTPLYARKAERIRRLYEQIAIGTPRVPVYSCIALDWFPGQPDQVRELAASQWVKPVRFQEAAVNLHDQGFQVFLEVGPGSRLTGFLRDSLRGRKHRALSSDAQDRSGLRQFLSSLAQLYVLGFPLDPSVLFRERRVAWPPGLELARPQPRKGEPATTAQRPSDPSDSPQLDILHGHLRLMEEFLAQQARIHSLLTGNGVAPERPTAFLPVVAQPEETRQATDTPLGLLGEPSKLSSKEARWDLIFSVESLPLLAHHTLGGRPSERDPSLSPLPVLPFAFAIELMAQAAVRLEPGLLQEMQEVRGLRWLALDANQLRLTLKATREPGGIFLELFECRAEEEILAYSARAKTASNLPLPPSSLQLEQGYQGKHKVSPAAFYSYVFHGRGFQGITSLRSVGPEGAEAEMVVVDPAQLIRHPAQADFLSNPVLQDCAGQLVGYWLLEHHGLVDIGLYPYRLGKLSRFGPEPRTGSTVLCRARIGFDGRCTEADFDLIFEGQVFARIEGFESRLFRFPAQVFSTLFAVDHRCFLSRELEVKGVHLSLISGLSQELFDSSWGIWRRALAQVTLTAAERRAWLEVPPEEGTGWLLQRLAVKDAVRRWAARRGLELLPADIECGTDGRTLGGDSLELLAPLPQVAVSGRGTFAVAALSEAPEKLGLASFEGDPELAARYAAAQASEHPAEEWQVSSAPSPKDTIRLARHQDVVEVALEAGDGQRRIALCRIS